MGDHGSTGLDVFGIKPIADAALVATRATTDGVGAFLSRICLPAAEEFGFLLRDKVSGWREHSEWRQKQAENILLMAENKISNRPNYRTLKAHPRMVKLVIEHGTWTDSNELHAAWSGLLCSSCQEQPNDYNLGFMTLLSSITAFQVKLFNMFMKYSNFFESESGLLFSHGHLFSAEKIVAETGLPESDWHIMDYQIDGLREMGLLSMFSGVSTHNRFVGIEVSGYGISFYCRCQGWDGPPKNYLISSKTLDKNSLDELAALHFELISSPDPQSHPEAHGAMWVI